MTKSFTTLQKSVFAIKNRTNRQNLGNALQDSRAVEDALLDIINHVNNGKEKTVDGKIQLGFSCDNSYIAKTLQNIQDRLRNEHVANGGAEVDVPRLSFPPQRQKKTQQKTIKLSAIKAEAEKMETSVEAITTSHKNAGYKIIDDLPKVTRTREQEIASSPVLHHMQRSEMLVTA